MKIIHVTPYYPPHLGGMEIAIKEFFELSKKNDIDAIVLTSNIGGNKKNKIKSTTDVIRLKTSFFLNVPILWNLFWEIFKRANKETIVHLHTAIILTPEIAYLAARLKRAKVISHVHLDTERSTIYGYLLPLYNQIFLKYILKNSDRVICPTTDYISLLNKKYGVQVNKIKIVPYGIHYDQFKDINPSHCDETRLIFVGRFSEQKDLPFLIDVVEELKKKRKIKLYLIGEGNQKQKLQILVKSKKLEKAIIFNNKIDHSKIQNAYLFGDIFVLSSNLESFGIVLIEAMACGLPLVVSDIAGVRCIINNGENGFLCKKNIKDFCEKINLLIDDKELFFKISKNNKIESRKYDWKKSTENLIEIYRRIIK